MKVQFEGDILVGNHGGVIFKNWTIKADDGETQKDAMLGVKRLILDRLELASAMMREEIADIEKGGDSGPSEDELRKMLRDVNSGGSKH